MVSSINNLLPCCHFLHSQVLQDTKSLIKHADQETLRDTNSEECKLFLKYLGDDKVLDTLKSNWLPDVVSS